MAEETKTSGPLGLVAYYPKGSLTSWCPATKKGGWYVVPYVQTVGKKLKRYKTEAEAIKASKG